MASVTIENLHLTYPVIIQSGSLRKIAVDTLVGGLLRRKKSQPDIINVDAINGISLSAKDGDRIGIVGHNGAGKSTLLKVLAGIYKPTTGTIKVEGKVESLLGAGFGLDPEETGMENIRFVLRMMAFSEADTQKKAQSIAEFTELGEFLDLPIRVYSSGMSTRLSFALATSIRPEILLMDEVIGAGDASFFKKAEARMDELSRNTKIIFLASHSNKLIEEWCNSAIWMDKGIIKARGDVETVLDKYSESI